MMWGGDWGWIGGGLMMLLFWGGLIALIVFLVRGTSHPTEGGETRRQHDARDILAERFARGEIDVEEYHERLEVLDARASRHDRPRSGEDRAA